MLEQMLALIRSQSLAVLATQGEGRPRASLMSYLWGDEGRVLYLITQEGTSKLANLRATPQVSLLIDDRAAAPDTGRVRALTLDGEASLVADPAQEAALKERFAAELPHVAGLAKDPACRALEVRVRCLLLLDGPTQATRLELY
ncbi:MAG: pyridoxamine 5'-phosphate oxidase family protein [Desulfarculaceae bacterium]|nr:pyridoxamine 5'-phosphate oxidase family protein [Desulfarculaceae bacterium]MCF8074403.1 pyridoxamine 5'-phosphate oxidase family protein [Desulfarculaceae bacterium]MCF8103621.1 pyridoxamine 5'-phosphate oxidase family protein [Desulfarculaceae bacterium]MCF8116034.1 pyridoxamine 5'-phosphate oxidase family protein [Desulfarculaceae bacterium]